MIGKNSGELSNITTHELVEELMQREGVESKRATPYEDLKLHIDEPVIVLVVLDMDMPI